MRWIPIVLCLVFAAADGYAQNKADESYTPQSGQQGKDVIWMPTLQELVATMLDLAKVAPSDYVIDLGSGDGRTVIAAAKRGATALGIEYNPDLVEFAKRAAAAEGVSANAKFEEADIFDYDFSKASVLTLFLLPDINLKLRPKILNMKPGTRILSNTFDMGDWEPDQSIQITEHTSYYTTAHLWIVPAKVHGLWKFGDGRINFTQNYQKLAGTMTMKGREMQLTGKLNGNAISFTAGGAEYAGTVTGATISGTYAGGGAWKAIR